MGKATEAENKLMFPLASLNRQTVVKSGEWGELKRQTVTGIMGSRAQFKLQRTPVNRSGQRFTTLKGGEDGARGKEGFFSYVSYKHVPPNWCGFQFIAVHVYVKKKKVFDFSSFRF